MASTICEFCGCNLDLVEQEIYLSHCEKCEFILTENAAIRGLGSYTEALEAMRKYVEFQFSAFMSQELISGDWIDMGSDIEFDDIELDDIPF